MKSLVGASLLILPPLSPVKAYLDYGKNDFSEKAGLCQISWVEFTGCTEHWIRAQCL